MEGGISFDEANPRIELEGFMKADARSQPAAAQSIWIQEASALRAKPCANHTAATACSLYKQPARHKNRLKLQELGSTGLVIEVLQLEI